MLKSASVVWMVELAVGEIIMVELAVMAVVVAVYSVQSAGAGWAVVLAVSVFQLVCVQV